MTKFGKLSIKPFLFLTDYYKEKDIFSQDFLCVTYPHFFSSGAADVQIRSVEKKRRIDLESSNSSELIP